MDPIRLSHIVPPRPQRWICVDESPDRRFDLLYLVTRAGQVSQP
jgi:hypothetical protein